MYCFHVNFARKFCESGLKVGSISYKVGSISYRTPPPVQCEYDITMISQERNVPRTGSWNCDHDIAKRRVKHYPFRRCFSRFFTSDPVPTPDEQRTPYFEHSALANLRPVHYCTASRGSCKFFSCKVIYFITPSSTPL